MAYMRKRGLDIRIARIFNTYGPRMRKNDGRVVITFIAQALDGEPLSVFGDGSQTRSLCYVSDLIDGIYKLMLSDINEPVNLGNPEELSILEIARRIIQIAGSQSQIIYKALPENDPKMRRPDIARAQKSLEWSPLISLNDGLRKTIDWFNQVEQTGEPKKPIDSN
jgi:dTDP-glucose 4,6-dehydratase